MTLIARVLLSAALPVVILAGCSEDEVIYVGGPAPSETAGTDNGTDGTTVDPATAAVPVLEVAQVNAPVQDVQFFAHACQARADGTAEGDRVSNLKLTNCLGEEVELFDACGKYRALWLITAAGWCGSCIAHFPEVVAMTDELRSEGLQTWIVLGEDDQSQEPTLEYCESFARAHDIDPRKMFVTGSGFQPVWDVINPGGDGSVGLPWEAVLDPYDMTYFWNGALPQTTIDQAIGQLIEE